MYRHRSLNAALAQLKRVPFGVNTTIELKNITTTSDNTGTIVSRNILRLIPLLSNAVNIYFSPIVVLAPNGQLLIVPLLHSVSDMVFVLRMVA